MKNDADTELVKRILGAIRSIRYGSVEVVIHDSKIVRIEKREKIRLDSDLNPDQKSGG
jgi:hypothetical protein